MDDLQALYQLQQLELELDKLQKTLKELPVFAAFKQLQVEKSDAKEASGWAETKLKEQRKRVRRLEVDLKQTEEEQKNVAAMLYDGSIDNVKELEQLDKKAGTLAHERGEKEETLLLAMESRENLDQTFTQAEEKFADFLSQLQEMQTTGNLEIGEIKEKIAVLQAQKTRLIEQISKPLLDEFNDRRKKYNGRPLARVEKDICGGCRVSVPSIFKTELRKPNSRIYCDYCGRLLVLVNEEQS